ncbi:MAG: glycine dehydrogenase, partial [Fimbriimonadaceae bacterium]
VHDLRQIAEATVRNTQYAIQRLTEAGGRLKFGGRVFGEFVLELPREAAGVRDALLDRGILAGLPLGPYDAELGDCLLVAVTETRSRDQIDRFADEMKAVLS